MDGGGHMGFATDCIHAGQEPDPSTGAIITPIFQTSTYVQQGIGQHKGYEYARTQNPTRRALEKNLAALERGTDAYGFAAGVFALLWIETPTNPLMKVCDIAALAQAAHRRRALLVVDNTFMSPFFQRPLELGADIVVHSTTKYLNGHSDSVGGVAVLKRKDDADRLQFIQNAAGAILSPFDSWLVLRGIKTLPIRMEAHNASGMEIAKYLADRKQV